MIRTNSDKTSPSQTDSAFWSNSSLIPLKPKPLFLSVFCFHFELAFNFHSIFVLKGKMVFGSRKQVSGIKTQVSGFLMSNISCLMSCYLCLVCKKLLSNFSGNSCGHQWWNTHSANITDIYSTEIKVGWKTAHLGVFRIIQITHFVVIKCCSAGSECRCNCIVI